MTKSIIINAKGSILRAAVIENKVLDNLFVDKKTSCSFAGNVYIGRIEKYLPSIQAAFVNIGIGKNGFLQLKDIDLSKKYEVVKKTKPNKRRPFSELKEGQNVLVQVVKEEIGTKGVRLDTQISLPGHFLVLMGYGHGKVHVSKKVVDVEQREYIFNQVIPKLTIPSDIDVIIRTAAAGVKVKFIQRDIDVLLKTWQDIQKEASENTSVRCVHEELDLVRKLVRDWLDDKVENVFVDESANYEKIKAFIKKYLANPKIKLRLYDGEMDIFDKFGITPQIEKLYAKKVWLRCGGYIVIDKAEALVAIDVNTGKNIKHSNSEATIFETNMEASEVIARQLRLRNMGGIVIVDFIDMKNKSHQRDVLKHLQTSLEKDKAKSKIYNFSKLGLVQMTRQRVEESWEQHYFIDCERCSGSGRILSVPIICDQIVSKMNRFLVINPNIHLNVRANDEIIEYLLKNRSLEKIEKQFRIEIGYLKDKNCHPEKYLIIRKDSGIDILMKSV